MERILRHTRAALLISACACALMTSSARPAHAQQQGTPIEEWGALEWGIGLGMPMTTTTSASASTVINMRERRLERKIERIHQYVWVRDHLEDNELGLRQDLALGAGPILEDLLSQLYPDQELTPELSARVRKDRARLSAILDRDADLARAALLCDTLDAVIGVTPAPVQHAHATTHGGN